MAIAWSSVMRSLNPVQRMIGVSGLMRRSYWEKSVPVVCGIVISVMTGSHSSGPARNSSRASILPALVARQTEHVHHLAGGTNDIPIEVQHEDAFADIVEDSAKSFLELPCPLLGCRFAGDHAQMGDNSPHRITESVDDDNFESC